MAKKKAVSKAKVKAHSKVAGVSKKPKPASKSPASKSKAAPAKKKIKAASAGAQVKKKVTVAKPKASVAKKTKSAPTKSATAGAAKSQLLKKKTAARGKKISVTNKTPKPSKASLATQSAVGAKPQGVRSTPKLAKALAPKPTASATKSRAAASSAPSLPKAKLKTTKAQGAKVKVAGGVVPPSPAAKAGDLELKAAPSKEAPTGKSRKARELPEIVKRRREIIENTEKEVVLTDAEGRRYCKAPNCDQLANVDGYCRFHYLLFWKKIQVRKKILTEGKLERYIEELTARYPDKYLEMLRRDLQSEKEFLNAIRDLDIEDSGDDNDFEDDAQNFVDEMRTGSGGNSGREEEDF